MKFKTDENLPEEAAELLRSAGHDASTVIGQSMGGAPDPDLASLCRREQCVLVTLDLGFADIRTYPSGGVQRSDRAQVKAAGQSVFC